MRYSVMALGVFLASSFFLISQNSYSQLFAETFEKDMPEYWRAPKGSWKVKDKQYTLDKGFGYALTKECTYREFDYEADITIGKKGDAGLLFNVCPVNATDQSMNAYYAGIDAEKDSVYLFKIVLKDENNKQKKEQTRIISVHQKIEPDTKYKMKVSKKGHFIEFFLNQNHLVSIKDNSLTIGAVGLLSDHSEASFDNILVSNLHTPSYNWSWVKGAIYIPTNCVNQIQQWEEFDPAINDRELRYASVYGLNTIRIYLHYLVYEKNKEKFLKDLETFLTLADKHNLKVVVSFFDDVWDGEPHLGPQLAPVLGQHNKRWAQCPGNKIKENYGAYKDKLKAYVQDVVDAHFNDPRILFWEPYNEPGFLQKGKYLDATITLLNDSRIWIKETGTPIPLTSTADPDFKGLNFSDFYSWHSYHRGYQGPEGPEAINTECMNRVDQTLAGIIDNFGKRKNGYIVWELGIGRTNSRFSWISPKNSPEPSMPFQGLIYPDGHPWDTNEVALIRGKVDDLPVFNVAYYTGQFELEKKWSFTPSIDFDLGDERGTGSPDASIGIDKDNFSIRWTGQVLAKEKGAYTFYVDTDHIGRMWLDGKPLINKTEEIDKEAKAVINLDANELYDLKVEYIHQTGDASMHLYWEGPGFSKESLPGRRAPIKAEVITKETMFTTK